MKACQHGCLCPVEQVGQGLVRIGLRRADADGERDTVAPPAEIGGAGQAGERLRMGGEGFGCAFMREHQKLVFAPAPQLLGGTQAMQEDAFHLVDHALACPAAMSLPQALCLVDGNPQHAEGNGAFKEVRILELDAILEFASARLVLEKRVAVAARQGVEILGGAKDDRISEAAPEIIFERQHLDEDRQLVAKPVADVKERFARRRWVRCGGANPLPEATDDESAERIGNRCSDHVCTGMPRNGRGSAVPEPNAAFLIGASDAFRQAVENGLQQLSEIDHARPPNDYIGGDAKHLMAAIAGGPGW